MQSCMHTLMDGYLHTYIRAYIHTGVYTYTFIHTHTCIYRLMDVCAGTHIYKDVHIYMSQDQNLGYGIDGIVHA